MSKTRFYKEYTDYEILKYQFENGIRLNKSYITREYSYSNDPDYVEGEPYKYIFNCCECGEQHLMKHLTFANEKLICKCGARFSADDLKPGIKLWGGYNDFKIHNLRNDTFNKVSVPTVIAKEWFYCNKCRKTQRLAEMPIENKQRVCKCGEHYHFEEVKLQDMESYNYTSGRVYFDGHKISVSFMQYRSSINAHRMYYWQEGNQRLTMNLETGFSYMTNTGCCYTDFNKFYKERHGKNAPKMYNSTYSVANITLETAATAMVDRLMLKYKDHPSLIKLIIKNYSRLKQKIFTNLFKQIDEYMTNYYNNKYCYRIKSLSELIEETHVALIQPDWQNHADKKSVKTLNMYDSYIITLRNRFINLSYKQLRFTASEILNAIQFVEEKRNYKKLPRETNNIALDYVCNTVPVSKRLRKRISAYIDNRLENSTNLNDRLYIFTNICRFFKNKENINKVFEEVTAPSSERYFRYELSEPTMRLWMKYRNEQYISNCSYKELDDKSRLMDDARRIIERICSVYGDDWDLNSIRFHTEQQFHDDLTRITTSDDFIEIVNRRKHAEQLKPFKMEEEVFELEEEENDFYIARNRAILTNIGQAMGICVGGYGGSVESGRCRIAYIKENGVYKVCLELEKNKNINTNKMEYTIVQAKLQYNKLVGTNDIYYNKVLEWATRNNIAINTNDMKIQQSKQVQYLEY